MRWQSEQGGGGRAGRRSSKWDGRRRCRCCRRLRCCYPWDCMFRTLALVVQLRCKHVPEHGMAEACPPPPLPRTAGCGRCRRKRHTCLLRCVLMRVPEIHSACSSCDLDWNKVDGSWDGRVACGSSGRRGQVGARVPAGLPLLPRPYFAAMQQPPLVPGGWPACHPPRCLSLLTCFD